MTTPTQTEQYNRGLLIRGLISRHEYGIRTVPRTAAITVTDHTHDVHHVSLWTAPSGTIMANESYQNSRGSFMHAAASILKGVDR